MSKLIRPYIGKEEYIFLAWDSSDRAVVTTIVEKLQYAGFRIWYTEEQILFTRKAFERLENANLVLFFVSKSSILNGRYKRFIENAIEKNLQKTITLVLLDEEVLLDDYLDFLTTAYQRMYFSEASEDDFIEGFKKNYAYLQCQTNNRSLTVESEYYKRKRPYKLYWLKKYLPVCFGTVAILILMFVCLLNRRKNEHFVKNDITINLDEQYSENRIFSEKNELNKDSSLWHLIRRDLGEDTYIPISTSFEAIRVEAELSELQEYVMTDPVICDMIIRAICDISPNASEYTYRDINSWLDSYIKETEYNNNLLGFLKKSNDEYLLTESFGSYATEVCGFLEHFEIKNDTISGTNWVLVGDYDNFHAEPGNTEKENALVFYYSELDDNETILFGISLNDKHVIVP